MITVLDTSICTENLGDQIIMDAVRRELNDLFPDDYQVFVPTHDTLGDEAIRLLRASRLGFVGGTNLLSSNMRPSVLKGTLRHRIQKIFKPSVRPYNQWKLRPADLRRLTPNLVLLGVGWWQYQKDPVAYTRELLSAVLDPALLHSVRDGYTLRMLQKAGVAHALNTSCVTLWRLTPEHVAAIPADKADEVVTTLTFYKADPAADRRMLETLTRRYRKVHLWIQGTQDLDYARNFHDLGLSFVSPNLAAFDRILEREEAIDYVGTRLHAGVRALQKKRRSLIVSVDNRATEISRDTGLPVIERTELDRLDALVVQPRPTKLDLPWENIARWKAQFRSA